MIYIPVYNNRGQKIKTLDYDYNSDVQDATGKIIEFPDRLFENEVNGITLSKLFYRSKKDSVVENIWYEKVKQYRTINDKLQPNSEVMKTIDLRLNDLILTGIHAKRNYEGVVSGDTAEQLFRTLTFIGTKSNPLIEKVITTAFGLSKKQWIRGLENKLIDLDNEGRRLTIIKNDISKYYVSLDNLKIEEPTIEDENKKKLSRNSPLSYFTPVNVGLAFLTILGVRKIIISRRKKARQ